MSNERLTIFYADFRLGGFLGTVARTHNIRLKEILKEGLCSIIK